MLPWFFTFIVGLCWCLCIWWNSNLFQNLWTGFGGKRSSACGTRAVAEWGLVVLAPGKSWCCCSLQLHQLRSLFTKIAGVFIGQDRDCLKQWWGLMGSLAVKSSRELLIFLLLLGLSWQRVSLLDPCAAHESRRGRVGTGVWCIGTMEQLWSWALEWMSTEQQRLQGTGAAGCPQWWLLWYLRCWCKLSSQGAGSWRAGAFVETVTPESGALPSPQWCWLQCPRCGYTQNRHTKSTCTVRVWSFGTCRTAVALGSGVSMGLGGRGGILGPRTPDSFLGGCSISTLRGPWWQWLLLTSVVKSACILCGAGHWDSYAQTQWSSPYCHGGCWAPQWQSLLGFSTEHAMGNVVAFAMWLTPIAFTFFIFWFLAVSGYLSYADLLGDLCRAVILVWFYCVAIGS